MMKRPTTIEDVLQQIIITIDGPSGSGKTTTAREVARRLRLRHLDTGAMYRAVTLKAMREGRNLADEESVGILARHADISFVEQRDRAQRVVLDDEDVSEAIRSTEVTRNVSLVSSHPSVRHAMVRQQRALADRGGVVLEGRDIGSVVLPHAEVKIYLDATLDVRAERRHKELGERGVNRVLQDVRDDLEVRDYKDSTRDVSPLIVPVGARIIDTSHVTIDGQVEEVIAAAKESAARILALVADADGARRLRRRPLYFAASQAFIRLVLHVLWGIRIVRKARFDYAENYIFACNHKSYADPPFVGSTIARNVFFVAKQGLFRNRLFGALIRKFNAIPIRRTFDRVSMDMSVELLRRGHSLLIVPEGTRIFGDGLGEARPGIGYIALKSGKSVVPIYARGTNRLLGGLLRRPRLTVVHGRPIRPTETDLTNFQEAKDFREFGQMVMRAIEALKDEQDDTRRRSR